VERANRVGYQPSKKGLRAMKKAKIRPTLIAALSGEELPTRSAEATPVLATKKVDLTSVDGEIDFDSVPPPKNAPKPTYASASKAEEPKKLDVSTRPAQPFVPPTTHATETASSDGKPRRVVYRPEG